MIIHIKLNTLWLAQSRLPATDPLQRRQQAKLVRATNRSLVHERSRPVSRDRGSTCVCPAMKTLKRLSIDCFIQRVLVWRRSELRFL